MRTEHRRRGATLVEAAFVLIVLFTFLMAILEFGRAYNVYQTMTDAAREGARFAVSPCSLLDQKGCHSGGGKGGARPSDDEVKLHVKPYLDLGVAKNAEILVTQTGTSVKYTQVKISELHKFLFFPWSITIRTEAVMRNEDN